MVEKTVGVRFLGSGFVSIDGCLYRLDRTVDVEFCEQVGGDRCKCSRCETVIDFKKDSFCRGCGAEIYS